MKRFNFFLILSVFAIFSASCSKEKKIEKNLWREHGRWDIVGYRSDNFYDNQYLYSFIDGISGFFQFNKDGKGELSIISNNGTNNRQFVWSCSDNELFFTIGTNPFTHKILSYSRNLLVIQEIQEGYDNGKPTKTIITFTLKKSK